MHRNDARDVEGILGDRPDAILISPGPCTPTEAASAAISSPPPAPSVPLMGVCLGHQAIGQVFGGDVVRAPLPMHGKLSEIPA